MEQPDGIWVSVSEASRRLGITRTAIRKRIARGTLDSHLDNHGFPRVLIFGPRVQGPSGTDTIVPPVPDEPLDQVPSLEPRESFPGASEPISASIHQGMIKALEEAHGATVTALQSQLEQLRVDATTAQARADRQLSERDYLYRDQTALMIERIDAAEVRAETAESRLALVLDTLLQRQTVRPWWRWWRWW